MPIHGLIPGLRSIEAAGPTLCDGLASIPQPQLTHTVRAPLEMLLLLMVGGRRVIELWLGVRILTL